MNTSTYFLENQSVYNVEYIQSIDYIYQQTVQIFSINDILMRGISSIII